MDDRQRVGFATIRLERVGPDPLDERPAPRRAAVPDPGDRGVSPLRVRVMTCADVGSDVPATSEIFDDPEEAIEAIGSFVEGWSRNPVER